MDNTTTTPEPKRLNDLQRAISAAASSRETTPGLLQSLVGNVVVGQLLPGSAVKGGTMLKLRFGDSVTRQTPDLDTAFRGDLQEFVDDLEVNLANGWANFTGHVVIGDKRAPETVPTAYVMQPAAVKLKYKTKNFCTVDLEIGYDELEATTKEPAEAEMSSEIIDLFVELGLPEPQAVQVLPLAHQIAQKLHACSEPGSERAHDLVDLQLMADKAEDHKVKNAAERLFAFRAAHTWPPAVEAGPRWDTLYADALEGVSHKTAHATVTDAVRWVNDYIGRIDAHPGNV